MGIFFIIIAFKWKNNSIIVCVNLTGNNVVYLSRTIVYSTLPKENQLYFNLVLIYTDNKVKSK